jgi:hypothetical protein
VLTRSSRDEHWLNMSMRSLSLSTSSLLLGLAFACDNAELVASRTPRASGGSGGVTAGNGGIGATAGAAGSGKAGSGSAGSSADGFGGEGGNVTDAGSSFGGAGNDSGDAGEGGAGMGAGGAGGTSGGAGSGGGGVGGSAGTGGSAGMAGNAGTAGDGGSGGRIEPTPVCDDGNPCTLDRFSDGACRNTALPDGTLCDDGDLCTLGDHCESRECVRRERNSGPLSVLGRVRSYGNLKNGVVVSPGDDRYVFVEIPGLSVRLTSTHLSAGALHTDASLDFAEYFNPPVATAFGDLVAVADGNTSFSLNGPPRKILLASLGAGGALTARGSVAIGSGTVPALTTLTGSGNRLFLCSNFAFIGPPVQGTLHWIDVSDPDAPVVVATGAVGAACGSIATSVDASRVYVNTPTGVRIADLSKYDGSGTIVFEDEKLVSTDSGLHVRGDRLVARSGDELRVFHEPTRELLHSFNVPGAHAAALTNGGIFVQGDRPTEGGTDFYAALYGEDGELRRDRSVFKVAYSINPTSQRSAAGANSAVYMANMQLFSVVDFTLIPVSSPRVGAFNQLFSTGDEIQARSRLAAHRIDVTDPRNPTILAGGPHRNPWLGIKLDESLSPSQLLAEVDLNGSDTRGNVIDVRTPLGHTTSTRVERITLDGTHHVPISSFEVGPGPAALLSAGDFIYRVELGSSGSMRFRRFAKSDSAFGIAAASMDLELDAPTSAFAVHLDVDPVARRAVVTANRYTSGMTARLHFVNLATDPPSVMSSHTLDTPPDSLRLRGDTLAYTDGDGVRFRRIGESADESSLTGLFVDSILAFDGRVAYAGGEGSLYVVRRGVSGESALLAQEAVGDTPTALVSSHQSLVLATPGELLTLSPECR